MDQKLELNIVPRTKVREQLLGSRPGEALMGFCPALLVPCLVALLTLELLC